MKWRWRLRCRRLIVWIRRLYGYWFWSFPIGNDTGHITTAQPGLKMEIPLSTVTDYASSAYCPVCHSHSPSDSTMYNLWSRTSVLKYEVLFIRNTFKIHLSIVYFIQYVSTMSVYVDLAKFSFQKQRMAGSYGVSFNISKLSTGTVHNVLVRDEISSPAVQATPGHYN